MVCCLSSTTQGAHVRSRCIPTFEVGLAGEGVNAGNDNELECPLLEPKHVALPGGVTLHG